MFDRAGLTAFHRSVRRLHAAAPGAGLSETLLASLRDLIPADIMVVHWRGCRLHGSCTAYDPGNAISQEVYQAVHRNLTDNPFYGRRNREASSISDHLSLARWHRTALYNEGYGRAGQQDGLAVDLVFAGGAMLSLAATRSRRGFSDTERQLLTLFRTHAADVYQRQISRQGLGHYLDLRPDGTFLYPPAEGALLLLDRYAVGWRTVAGLSGDLGLWFARITAPVSGDGPPPSFRTRFSRGRYALEVCAIPSPADPGHFQLYLEERHSGAELLTPREAQVLAWLREGKTNAEIAILLEIRPGTVKRHLENLYAKLGVENRHAAARWGPV